MSKAEIMQARKILAQRNELTRRNGFEAELCDPQFRSYYHPDSPKGQQIYQSYSDEELLDILIAVMQHHGHSPQFDKIHHVYKLYLSKRFENLAQAKAKARARQKAIAQQDKWPSNWSEHIDPEPFYKWIQEKGQEVTEEDKCVIEAICDDARKTG